MVNPYISYFIFINVISINKRVGTAVMYDYAALFILITTQSII